MALVARYLLDTSAASRLTQERVASRVVPLLTAGLLATCAALDLEALYSARSGDEYSAVRADRRLAYEYLPTDDVDWSRALQVQSQLAVHGQWRAAGLADLVICAVAERHRVAVLHDDADFDVVAALSGQPVEWVVPRGSLS